MSLVRADHVTARRLRASSGLVAGLLLVLLAVGGVQGATVTRMLRAELEVQRATVRDLLKQLEGAQTELEESWSRVDRLALDLLRAQRDGEDSQSLASRDSDVRDAEGELMMRLFACQRIRASLTTARRRIVNLERELKKLEAGEGNREDPISGRWKLVVDPGGLEGQMELNLKGTLIDGTYHLQGGWFGSFRGTLVAGRVRLERVDSRLGFAAVFYGELTDDEPPRLQGTWEGTHLTAGQPSSGTWLAEKIDETQDSGTGSEYPGP